MSNRRADTLDAFTVWAYLYTMSAASPSPYARPRENVPIVAGAPAPSRPDRSQVEVLEKNLRPGTRVIVHDIRIPRWRSAQDEAIQIGGGTHFVYLYKIPEAFQR